MTTGNWELGIGNWESGIGNWELLSYLYIFFYFQGSRDRNLAIQRYKCSTIALKITGTASRLLTKEPLKYRLFVIGKLNYLIKHGLLVRSTAVSNSVTESNLARCPRIHPWGQFFNLQSKILASKIIGVTTDSGKF